MEEVDAACDLGPVAAEKSSSFIAKETASLSRAITSSRFSASVSSIQSRARYVIRAETARSPSPLASDSLSLRLASSAVILPSL